MAVVVVVVVVVVGNTYQEEQQQEGQQTQGQWEVVENNFVPFLLGEDQREQDPCFHKLDRLIWSLLTIFVVNEKGKKKGVGERGGMGVLEGIGEEFSGRNSLVLK